MFWATYSYCAFLSRGRRDKPKPYGNNPGKLRIYKSNSPVKRKGQHKGAKASKHLLMKPTHTPTWKVVIQVPISNQTVMWSAMLPSQVNPGIQMLVYQSTVDEIENEVNLHRSMSAI